MFLTRSELLGRTARRFTTIDLLGGGKARIRSLTEAERTRHELGNIDPKSGEWSRKLAAGHRRRLVALCVVDEDGNPILSEEDVLQLANVDAALVNQLFDASRDWNGYTDSDVEDLEKNSATPRGSGSSTDSPSAGESSTSSAGDES